VSDGCTHPDGWSERDDWYECWLCGEQRDICPGCGRPADTFACKIRHIQLNTGAAKAARD
jgi:hypothetical protein